MTDRERYFNDILCEMETARDRMEDLSKEEIQKIKSIIRVANQMLSWDKEFKEENLNLANQLHLYSHLKFLN